MDNVQVIALYKNIGRSKIRNLFIKKASFEHLLFIDCDCTISSKDYLNNYIHHIDQDVVYGGRKHHKTPPKDKSLKLRWKYGIKKEDQTFNYRVNNPYQSFKSNNFLIKKSILSKIKFNEEIKNYGHAFHFYFLYIKKEAFLLIQ